MSHKDFDNRIKNSVDEHPSAIDVNAFWVSIEEGVMEINAKKKKKRRMVFYLFGAVSLLVGGLLVSLVFINGAQDEISFEGNFEQKKLEKNEKIDEILLEEKANLNLEDKSVKETASEFVAALEQAYNGLDMDVQNSDKSLKKRDLSSTDLVEVRTPKTESISLPFHTKNETPTNSIEKTNENSSDKKTKNPIVQNRETAIVVPLYSSIPFLDEGHHDLNLLPKNEKSFEFKIGIQGGLNFATRNLESLNSAANDYASLRNETESPKIGFQFGLKTGLKHKSGLTFSTGFNYTEIREQFKFQGSTFDEVFVENGIIRYEIHINMDTIPIYGDFLQIQETIHNKDYENRYRLLEIPLLIGYQKDFDDWTLGVQAGIFANLSLQTSGMIFTPNSKFVILESEGEDYFKSKIGMNYYFGGEVKYLINDNIGLALLPHFRVFPKSFTNWEHGISQKYTLIGLNLGLDFRF